MTISRPGRSSGPQNAANQDYYASLLIASGADVEVVQHRVRHANAKTTLDTYGHLWPDSDESTRTAVERVLSAHLADSVRTGGGAS